MINNYDEILIQTFMYLIVNDPLKGIIYTLKCVYGSVKKQCKAFGGSRGSCMLSDKLPPASCILGDVGARF